jgi:hypothetical protein
MTANMGRKAPYEVGTSWVAEMLWAQWLQPES